MKTQIKIYDTLLENAKCTAAAAINPDGPLLVVFEYGGGMTATYMDYETGLKNVMDGICKNWRMVRKLKMLVEIEEPEKKLA